MSVVQVPDLLPTGFGYMLGSKSLYYNNAPRYWIRATNFLPYFANDLGDKISSSTKELFLDSKNNLDNLILLLNSSLFYFWYIVFSDCRHLNIREIESFPCNLRFPQKTTALANQLMNSFKQNKQRKETYYKTTGKVVYDEYSPKKSKALLDFIDTEIASYYAATEFELDHIISYDVKFRLGEQDEN